MSNLKDLNDRLFAQLDNLAAAKTADELKSEIDRSQSISTLSRDIINNARLALDAEKHVAEYGNIRKLPAMLEQK